MKFANYFKDIAGIELFPCISLILFVVFFLLVTYRILKINKKTLEHIERLPLDDN